MNPLVRVLIPSFLAVALAVSLIIFLPRDERDQTPHQTLTAAKKDLAKRLNVSLDQITVLRQSKVDWPDTSLGCPKKGLFYAQVITPGYKIILGVKGEEFLYHTNLPSNLLQVSIIDCTGHPHPHPGLEK